MTRHWLLEPANLAFFILRPIFVICFALLFHRVFSGPFSYADVIEDFPLAVLGGVFLAILDMRRFGRPIPQP